jgi:hypothetical protein
MQAARWCTGASAGPQDPDDVLDEMLKWWGSLQLKGTAVTVLQQASICHVNMLPLRQHDGLHSIVFKH